MELDGSFLYRQIWGDPKPAPHNVIVEQLSPGPPRSMWFSGRRKKWTFDPGTIHRVMMDDFDEATGYVTEVDRATAEKVARGMGQTLPDETELARMMDEGVARMTATDDWETPISFD
jgi:hypothetical protein